MAANLILSLCMLILSGVILTETAAYPDYSNLSVIGPEAIPNYLAYFIGIIALYLILTEGVKCFRGRKQNPSYAKAELEKSRRVLSALLENKQGLLRIVCTLILMFAFAELMKTVGFEICAAVFLVGAMLLNGVRKIWQLILVPAATIAFVYFAFVCALHVSVPMQFL